MCALHAYIATCRPFCMADGGAAGALYAILMSGDLYATPSSMAPSFTHSAVAHAPVLMRCCTHPQAGARVVLDLASFEVVEAYHQQLLALLQAGNVHCCVCNVSCRPRRVRCSAVWARTLAAGCAGGPAARRSGAPALVWWGFGGHSMGCVAVGSASSEAAWPWGRGGCSASSWTGAAPAHAVHVHVLGASRPCCQDE